MAVEIPNRNDHACFGCSSRNSQGLQMKFFAEDDYVFSDLIIPEHLCGWNNLVHGGVLSTVLDEIMSWTSIYQLKRIILTKSMTVDFLKPVTIGQPIRAEGKVAERLSEREARVDGVIRNNDGVICARASGLFALFTADAIEKRGIFDKELIDSFRVIIESPV